MSTMNVVIGISTWTFRNYPLEKALELISRSGGKYVECFANNYHLDPRCGDLNLVQVDDIIGKWGLTLLSIHGPFSRILPEVTLEKTRTKWANLTRETINRSAALKIPYMVLHPFCLTGDGLCKIKAFDVGNLIIGHIVPYAAKRGVTILLENPAPTHYYAYQRARELMELIPSECGEKIGICLDISHLICAGLDPGPEIRSCGSLLKSLHISDNNYGQKKDLHLPPGDGCVDWNAVFSALREIAFSGSFVLEVEGGESSSKTLVKSIEFIHRYI